ncbi:MAG: pyridoxamine 5'-phosphate oxidase [Bacteroidetes bacterium]|nr:MAG: pyridoxamine 5'-phosphate oxidase [Bacteroidota bacterium]
MSKKKKLHDFRKDYTRGGLNINDSSSDPFEQFNLWFKQAVAGGLNEPNAMIMSTATLKGKVSARTVLLKEVDQQGFIFYTNYNSQKASDLKENPYASLVFLWLELERQVRIEGKVEKISEVDSDTYFSSRPRESQLGAWASEQSKEIPSREVIIENYARLEKQYEGKSIPRPPFWGGYRLIPARIEFWQGRSSRLHDRILFHRNNTDDKWEKVRLSP